MIILIGVLLFSALLYAFSRGAQEGTGNITRQQAKITAQEILSYARLVEGAVDRVRRNGCSETEISFSNAIVSGYSNPNEPSDNSCHIFEDEGGKINFSNYQNIEGANYIFTAQDNFYLSGDNSSLPTIRKSELIIQLQLKDLMICQELLASMNSPYNPNCTDMTSNTKFTGTFLDVPSMNTVPDNNISGMLSPSECSALASSSPYTGCVRDFTALEQFIFYHVLLAR